MPVILAEFVFLVVCAAIASVPALCVFELWNRLVVPWAHAPHLSFWLALAVCVVLGMIFRAPEPVTRD